MPWRMPQRGQPKADEVGAVLIGRGGTSPFEVGVKFLALHGAVNTSAAGFKAVPTWNS